MKKILLILLAVIVVGGSYYLYSKYQRRANPFQEPDQGMLYKLDENRPKPCVGDVDGNGAVDINDMNLVKASMDKKNGEAGYYSHADINNNGLVNKEDEILVSNNIGCKGVEFK